jgi:hypothetical protein
VRLSTGRRESPVSRSALVGFRFPAEVIVAAVRWYLRYGLSYRDVRNCWPNAVSGSITSPSTGGYNGSRRCSPTRLVSPVTRPVIGGSSTRRT